MHGLIYFVFLIITFVFITLYIIVNTKLFSPDGASVQNLNHVVM